MTALRTRVAGKTSAPRPKRRPVVQTKSASGSASAAQTLMGAPLTASSVLTLQRTVGNRAASSVVVSRVPVPVTPFKPIAEFDTMTLGDFDSYAQSRPDWSTDTALAPARRAQLMNTLEFARADDPPPVGPLGNIPLKDIDSTGLPAATRKTLRTYSRGKVARDTAGLQATSVFADAMRDGAALEKLEAKVPLPQLHQTMGITDEGKGEFTALVAAGLIDKFGDYVQKGHPYLEADNGADITSFREMKSVDGEYADKYAGALPHVRNVHRFRAKMLDQLVTNEGDTSKAKPLLLILHTGSDHNGAFRRDLELMNLVIHPRNHAIMIEGPVSLEAAGAESEKVAKDHGQGGKIEQLMLAGHGAPHGMDLAGVPAVGAGLPDSGAIDLHKNKKKTEKFLKGLIKNMASGPNAKIMLNACLTAADEVQGNLSKDPKTAKKQILASLRNDPGLATRLKQLAPGRTVEGNLSSVPAGEYQGKDPITGLGTGVLHATVGSDTAATQSDRGVYIEEGTEAEGAIRAVVGLWAIDKAACLKHVEARTKKPPTGAWGDLLIHTFYDLVLKHPNDISLVNRIANDLSRGLSEMSDPSEQTPWWFFGMEKKFSKAELHLVFDPLNAKLPMGGRVALEQVWMLIDSSRRAEFMKALDTFATVPEAEPHLGLNLMGPADLKGTMAALLPLSQAKTMSSAQAKLALYSLDSGSKAAIAFLKKNAGTTLKLTLPGTATVPGLTGNNMTEESVLSQIGVLKEALTSSATPPNVDLDGDGIADVYVRSITRQAMITASELRVHSRPDGKSATVVDSVLKGAVVDVIGLSGKDFVAIDHHGVTRFISRSFVKGQPVL